ncbi:phosphoribosyltransferase family protein [Solibacillus sp. FSL H8-0538]|uniref:phosphoribosyltransferase family protein n=1 Tax=Solibacillus sp. FSL H8-0538 TaxID=2921400 RepID=UPI0030FBA9F2
MSSYNILDKIEASIKLVNNPYQFEEHQLFDMAMRINEKRRFLFVSKVLGKHLAIAPQLPILTSELLARRFIELRQQQENAQTAAIVEALKTQEQLQETIEKIRNSPLNSATPLKIIGFAETATALGHAFFNAFTGDVQFVHTTREQLACRAPVITFEEEHSHASSHRVYLHNPAFFDGDGEVVLVDDEMTTGKTNLNIIRQLHTSFPHLKVFTLVAILDWRNAEHQEAVQQLAQELNIKIHSVALMSGHFDAKNIGTLPEPQSLLIGEKTDVLHYFSIADYVASELVQESSLCSQLEEYKIPYYMGSGRFSLTSIEQGEMSLRLQTVIPKLVAMRTGKKCLVIGTGEFMYNPMYVASQMGPDVYYQSTTRSPIYAHEKSLIYNKFVFHSPEFPGVINYLYNIGTHDYDDIFLMFERILDEGALRELVAALQKQCRSVHIITFTND